MIFRSFLKASMADMRRLIAMMHKLISVMMDARGAKEGRPPFALSAEACYQIIFARHSPPPVQVPRYSCLNEAAACILRNVRTLIYCCLLTGALLAPDRSGVEPRQAIASSAVDRQWSIDARVSGSVGTLWRRGASRGAWSCGAVSRVPSPRVAQAKKWGLRIKVWPCLSRQPTRRGHSVWRYLL